MGTENEDETPKVELPEPPAVLEDPVPDENNRPPWVDDIVDAITGLREAMEATPEPPAPPVEPPVVVHEPDDTPKSVPWTHRGFGRKDDDE